MRDLSLSVRNPAANAHLMTLCDIVSVRVPVCVCLLLPAAPKGASSLAHIFMSTSRSFPCASPASCSFKCICKQDRWVSCPLPFPSRNSLPCSSHPPPLSCWRAGEDRWLDLFERKRAMDARSLTANSSWFVSPTAGPPKSPAAAGVALPPTPKPRMESSLPAYGKPQRVPALPDWARASATRLNFTPRGKSPRAVMPL